MSKTIKIRPEYNNIHYINKKTGEQKSKFDIISRDFRYILRANDSNKPLSRVARILLANYYNMISNSLNGIIFKDHKDIYDLTEVGISQNKRTHNELRDLFNIQYHQSIIIEGRKYRDGFTIEFTQNTEIILEDPKLFYSSQSMEKERVSVLKRTPSRPKKNAPLYIEEENPLENLKDRSIEIVENIPLVEESQKSNFLGKSLKDFYPLSPEDADRFKTLSGRPFNLNIQNQILLDMSRDSSAVFYSKKGFLSYMTIAYKKEMRDAVKTNNETFRIKANLTDEDKENRRIFKYLEKVEYSLEVSPELHFKKKLACVLEEKKAYNLLTSYKSLVIKDRLAKLYLRRMVELTPLELEIVLNQIKASHPVEDVEKLVLIPEKSEIKMQNNNLDTVILQKFGTVKGQEIIKNCSIKKLPEWNRRLYPHGAIEVKTKFGELIEEADKGLLRTCIREVYGEKVAIVAAKEKYYDSDENELWKQFKEFAQKHFRSDKDANLVLSSWFAKLKPSQNIGSNKLLFTGTKFMIDWVDSNYSNLIEEAVKQLKINVELIYENNCEKPILYESGIGKFKRLDEETINRLMKQPINIEEVK
jgi:hypothetical protein